MFRKITPQNWTDRDPTNEHFAMPDGHGGMRQMTGDDWAALFLGVEIAASVPEDVRGLFEVARNTLPYGHFFYPLYVLGAEQLYRVADAATLHRYRDLGGPKDKRDKDPPFFARIEWLREHGVIADEHANPWDAVRKLRNETSHPETQSVFMPGDAYRVLSAVARYIDALYTPPTIRHIDEPTSPDRR